MCEICHMTTCPSGCPNADLPKEICACKYCGEPIVVGDNYIDYYGDRYHEECFADAAVSILMENGAELKEATDDDVDDMSDKMYARYIDERYFGRT